MMAVRTVHICPQNMDTWEKVEWQWFRARAEMKLANPERNSSVDLRELLGR